MKVLATYLGRRFTQLRSVNDWEPYRPHDKPVADLGEWIVEYDDRASREHAILRRPSDNAQKVFAELVVVTVHMRGRWIHRRVTERLVTCRDRTTSGTTRRPATHSATTPAGAMSLSGASGDAARRSSELPDTSR